MIFERGFFLLFLFFHFLQILSDELEPAFVVALWTKKYMIVFLSCRFSRVRLLTCFSRDATATFILPSVMCWLLFYEGKNYDFSLSEAILEFTYNESERGYS